jgi:hypothetical protein
VGVTTKGILATIDAADGREAELESLLVNALDLVNTEPATTAWFAFRSGHGEYGIFDAFPDDAGRDAHLRGAVAAALGQHVELLDGEPQFDLVDVLADKRTAGGSTKGVLLRLPIKEAHRDDAASFLRAGRDIVADEPATVSWFAIRFANGDHGVFDVFPDRKGRRAHLTGRIPQQLALHGLPWLSGLPQLSMVDVLADKVDLS